MGSQQDKDIAWRRCLTADAAAREEERTCKKQGRHTMNCLNLVKDARKLKAEYEKVCRAPASNPLSVRDGLKFQREKIVGDLMGRNGPDTHHRIDGDKDRRGK